MPTDIKPQGNEDNSDVSSESYDKFEEQMQETLELDSFDQLQKTKSTVYDPNNDLFFSLVN